MKDLLQVSVSASYAAKTVLRDIRFTLHEGEVIGFVGTSGAGKSTLILSLLGMLPWRGGEVQGSVLFNGEDLLSLRAHEMRRLRGRHIALVPQSPMSALNPRISLRSHFAEAWSAHEPRRSSKFASRLEQVLGEAQLNCDPEFLNRRPSQISVGQAQRVMIALAMLHRPEILIADEPTSALDPVVQTEIISLLKRLNQTLGTALIYVSHDLISVLQLCSRVAVLDHGSLVEDFAVDDSDGACHPASVALLNALPVPARTILDRRGRLSLPDIENLAALPRVRSSVAEKVDSIAP